MKTNTTNFFKSVKKASALNKSLISEDSEESGISLDNSSNVEYIKFDDAVAPSSNISTPHQNASTIYAGGIWENKPESVLTTKEFENYSWDLLMVLPNVEKTGATVSILPEDIFERLSLSELQTYIYFSTDKSKIFIKIRASLPRLMEQATGEEFYFKLSEKYLQDKVDFQDSPIIDDPQITPYRPYEFIYSKYDQDKSYMYELAQGYQHPFSPIIRTKLILSIIQSTKNNGCHLNVRKLIADGSLLACFPLHDEKKRKQLQSNWFGWFVHPWRQPIDYVKDYFGEKIALYFEFVGHYTTWLLPLALIGFIVSLSIIVEAGIFHSFAKGLDLGYFIPIFCLFVSFWAQYMLEYWKRKEACKSLEWGMGEFEESESIRPEYFGEIQNSVINGKKEKFFSSKERNRRVLWSAFIITCMILLVIGCVSLIFFLQVKFSLSKNEGLRTYGNILVSVLSSIQIAVLGNYYSDLAIKLVDQENHRTDTEYDDALIAKLYGFSFINSYSSLFYLAFIKESVQLCTYGCFADLSLQLTIIFATRIIVDKAVRIFQNLIMVKWEAYKYAKEEKEAILSGDPLPPLSKPEVEFQLENSDPQMGVLEDFNEMATQFGYVTLFVGACPIAPLLAYISNWLEIRSDGFRLLFLSRRAIPKGAEDIGTWQSIFQLTAFVAVSTNAGLVCFSMQVLNVSIEAKIWIFIIAQYFVFTIMSIFSYVVDDVPEHVTIQLARQEYLSDLAHMSDEDRLNSRNQHVFKDVNTVYNNNINFKDDEK